MRILFLAPSICSPVSEGRKRFVLDLLVTLKENHSVFLLTSVNVGQKPVVPPQEGMAYSAQYSMSHLSKTLVHLSEHLKVFRPDFVCVFPFGTFHGVRGVASRLFMAIADRLCGWRKLPCLTIMYSIDEHTSAQALSKWVSHLAVSRSEIWKGYVVNVGLRYKHWAQQIVADGKKTRTKTILFMAGMWEQSIARVDHILNVRGLSVLLRAGAALAKEGIKLVVAAPLLSSQRCRNYLLTHPDNTWPVEHVDVRSFVSVPEIFTHTELFVFPYARPISQFVPTSVLEAMAANTPVLLSDHEFLQPLACNGDTALVFRSGDVNQLVDKVTAAFSDPQALVGMTIRARQYVEKTWSIDVSAQQIQDFPKLALKSRG